MSRDIEHEVLRVCREIGIGIGITAYGVLSRGLLTGSKGSGEGNVRNIFYPRFQGENLTRNERLAIVAQREGITAAQAAIAWVASRGSDIIPLVGARTVERLIEALASPFQLSQEALSSIEKAVPEDAVGDELFMVAH